MNDFVFKAADLNWREKVPGVYKITFDGTRFYIGGAGGLWQRMNRWRGDLRKGVFKNKNIAALFPDVKEVVFEVIEICSSREEAKEREDFYIKKYCNDEFFLNRAFNAYTNEGIKMDENQVAVVRERGMRYANKVAKLDLSGNLIEVYPSASEAARVNNLGRSLGVLFKKGNRTAKGYYYRKIDNNGNYIVPPIYPVKRRAPGYKVSPEARERMKASKQRKELESPSPMPDYAKPFAKYDCNGNEIERFLSFKKLAKHLNVDPGNLRKMLAKGRPGYYKGYFYFPA